MKKIHLIGSLLTTKCGKNLETVKFVIDIRLVTCKSCLKSQKIKY